MPYMRIDLTTEQLDAALESQLATGTTRLLAEVLHKRAEVTVVRVVATPNAQWYAAGAPLPRPGRAAYAEVKITRGSNTEAEKARFLAEFQCLIEATLGPLSAPAYAVIQEVPGSDWGYDGLSQSERKGRGPFPRNRCQAPSP